MCLCSDALIDQWEVRVAEERASLEEKHSKEMQVKLQEILFVAFSPYFAFNLQDLLPFLGS